MVRAPDGGDGKRSAVHVAASPLLTMPQPSARALGRAADSVKVSWPAGNPAAAARAVKGIWSVVDERRPHTGLGGRVAFGSSAGVHVPGGAARRITVNVIREVPEQFGSAAGNPGVTTGIATAFSVSVVDLRAGTCYIHEIGATTEAVRAR